MAELVERGAEFIQRQQGGLAGRRLGDVEVVDHHRTGVQQPGLLHEGIHPRTPALRFPRVVVAQEQAQVRAVGILHFPDAHVRVVAGEVGAFMEGDTVQGVRREEHTVVQNPVQLEVGPQGLLVHGIPLTLDLGRVIRPVPGLEGVTGGLGKRVGLGVGVADGGGGPRLIMS